MNSRTALRIDRSSALDPNGATKPTSVTSRSRQYLSWNCSSGPSDSRSSSLSPLRW